MTLQPHAPYNAITFHGERKVGTQPSPVKLAKFKKVQGAVVYDGLFQHYAGPNGDKCYFYHRSDIVCEALDPGVYPAPEKPTSMGQVRMMDVPRAPDLVVPSGASQYPPLYVPVNPSCPVIAKHCVPACMLANIFGGISSEPAPILAREATKKPPTPREIVQEVEPKKWELEESPLFLQRKQQEADSKDFYDNQRSKKRALFVDFKRLLNEPRFAK